jgi:hypothetical protein
LHEDLCGAVELALPDAFERRDGERDLDERGDRELKVRLDADLVAGVQVPDQERPP